MRRAHAYALTWLKRFRVGTVLRTFAHSTDAESQS